MPTVSFTVALNSSLAPAFHAQIDAITKKVVERRIIIVTKRKEGEKGPSLDSIGELLLCDVFRNILAHYCCGPVCCSQSSTPKILPHRKSSKKCTSCLSVYAPASTLPHRLLHPHLPEISLAAPRLPLGTLLTHAPLISVESRRSSMDGCNSQ